MYTGTVGQPEQKVGRFRPVLDVLPHTLVHRIIFVSDILFELLTNFWRNQSLIGISYADFTTACEKAPDFSHGEYVKYSKKGEPMKVIQGKYTSATVFTDDIDEAAIQQLQLICDQPWTAGAKIRIMPDAHAGKGCVIGFSANLGNCAVPSLIGVDIGCSMLAVHIANRTVNLAELDDVIHRHIPAGRAIHEEPIHYPFGSRGYFSDKLHNDLVGGNSRSGATRIDCSLGTLGGGNHFIELDQAQDRSYWLVIHTGSRSLGVIIEKRWQDIASVACSNHSELIERRKSLIETLKAEGRQTEIQNALKNFDLENPIQEPAHPELAYLTGADRDGYLADVRIAQLFAQTNQRLIAETIIQYMGFVVTDMFTTMHNYIDTETGIVRKGAIDASAGRKILIPLNMRDGTILAVGKGNADWNCTAPHGAGRKLSRIKAKQMLSMDEYQKTMSGIYTTSVSTATLDEAPDAYKPADEIIELIKPTAEVIDIIKPVYNFKAAD